MFPAMMLAIGQLPEKGLRRPLFDTLLWTSAILILVAFMGYRELDKLTETWGAPGALAAIGAITLFTSLAWLLFVIIENVILFCYANSIVAAVETRHYSWLRPARAPGFGASLSSGFRLLVWTVGGNLVVLPLYLLIPGANLILFLALNGYLLGRSYFDAVALRRLDDRSAREMWRREKTDFVINGVVSVIFLAIPLLNLVVPIVGLATAVHLFQRRLGATEPRLERF